MEHGSEEGIFQVMENRIVQGKVRRLVKDSNRWVMVKRVFFGALFFAAIANGPLFLGKSIFSENCLYAVELNPSKLLPEQTVVYVRIPNVQDFARDLKKLSSAEVFQDPAVAAILGQSFGEFESLYDANTEGIIGTPISSILNLPQGELVFAIVATERGGLASVFFLDIANDSTINTLVDSGKSYLKQVGSEVEVEPEGDYEIQFAPKFGENGLAFVLRDETLCVTTDIDMMHEILIRWEGIKIKGHRSLSENRKFNSVMNQCRTTGHETPAMLAYYDPVEYILKSYHQRRM